MLVAEKALDDESPRGDFGRSDCEASPDAARSLSKPEAEDGITPEATGSFRPSLVQSDLLLENAPDSWIMAFFQLTSRTRISDHCTRSI